MFEAIIFDKFSNPYRFVFTNQQNKLIVTRHTNNIDIDINHFDYYEKQFIMNQANLNKDMLSQIEINIFSKYIDFINQLSSIKHHKLGYSDFNNKKILDYYKGIYNNKLIVLGITYGFYVSALKVVFAYNNEYNYLGKNYSIFTKREFEIVLTEMFQDTIPNCQISIYLHYLIIHTKNKKKKYNLVAKIKEVFGLEVRTHSSVELGEYYILTK